MIENPDYEVVPPDATPVIESLRSIGYTLETAIADIIDNSIDAQAKNIETLMVWNDKQSYIRIKDDGYGMSESELVQAMRIGSKRPSDIRGKKELGRFGMGLKTASFSIGKKLTVLTKRAGNLYLRCWDLDLITETNDWTLLKEVDADTQAKLGEIESTSGTIVLIEKLDRIVTVPFTEKKRKKFIKRIHDVKQHLSMVFHPFLGSQKLKIMINHIEVKPWDPYLLNEIATQELPQEKEFIGHNVITIQPFILPHHSKISLDTYNEAGGPKGWFDQQGFYIYRNNRLLVAGGWLGMFTKEESYKLARIKVDITNTSDFDWQIDIKKSTARPPQDAVEILKRIADKARKASRKVYYYRGSYKINNDTADQHFDRVWDQGGRNGKSFFVLNKQHPLLKKLKEEHKEISELLEAYLLHVEEYCPSNVISFSPAIPEASKEKAETLTSEQRKVLSIVKNTMLEQGAAQEELLDNLSRFSIFANCDAKVILEALEEEEM